MAWACAPMGEYDVHGISQEHRYPVHSVTGQAERGRQYDARCALHPAAPVNTSSWADETPVNT
jgi:hypothetical protein